MLTGWNVICIIGLLAAYAVIAMGMKKYHMMDTVKSPTRTGKWIMIGSLGLLVLGILMSVAKTVEVAGDAAFSVSARKVTDVLFASNSAITSLVLLMITIVPAIIYQALFIDELAGRMKIGQRQMQYSLILYAVSACLYRNLSMSFEELLVVLFVSALLYYAVLIVGGNRSKKGMLYLAILVLFIVLFTYFGWMLQWKIYVVSLLLMLESLVMVWYRSKSIILRRTLRKLGTLLLVAIVAVVNYWIL